MSRIVLILIFGGIGALLYFLRSFLAKAKKGLTALTPNYQNFQLIAKTDVSPNTILFRFKLPSDKHRLGLPVGSHCLLRCEDSDGKPVSRPYTPVSSDDELGFFELIVKVYPLGKMGQHLKALPVGKSIEVKGPLGEVRYNGSGKFVIQRKKDGKKVPQNFVAKRVAMIAGGSGITPMLQIIRDVLKHPSDRTDLTLMFGNVTEPDILLRPELDKIARENKQFHLHYALDKPPAGWTGVSGYMDASKISKCLPAPAPDVLVLVCGPPMMLDFVGKQLTALDYREEQIFKY
jgi:cytochrome-b5 reductase